jgi:hypothetical protein
VGGGGLLLAVVRLGGDGAGVVGGGGNADVPLASSLLAVVRLDWAWRGNVEFRTV